MFDNNPWLLMCGLALCWPGIVPLVITAIVARRFDWRNPFIVRGGRGDV